MIYLIFLAFFIFSKAIDKILNILSGLEKGDIEEVKVLRERV